MSGLVEEDADPGVGEGVADADVLAVFLQQLVGGADALVLGDSQHPFGGVIVGGQQRLPVAQPGPLRILEERRPCPVERVCVAEAAAADAAAGDDKDVLEERRAAELRGSRAWVPRSSGGAGAGSTRRSPRRGSGCRTPAPRRYSPSRRGEAPTRSPRSRSRRLPSRSRGSPDGTALRLRPRPARAGGSPRSGRRRPGRTNLWGCPRSRFRAGCPRPGRRSPGRR